MAQRERVIGHGMSQVKQVIIKSAERQSGVRERERKK